MAPTPSSGTPTRRRRVLTPALVGFLLTVSLVTACGSDDTSDASSPTTSSTTPAATDERVVTARLVGIYAASASIELDEVEILTGDEARRAAVEAGDIDEGEDLPNDYWIRDESDATERLTVDPEATVTLYDCSGGCEPVAVDLGAFLRGEAQPYGGDHPIVEITVRGGMITSLAEVYLP